MEKINNPNTNMKGKTMTTTEPALPRWMFSDYPDTVLAYIKFDPASGFRLKKTRRPLNTVWLNGYTDEGKGVRVCVSPDGWVRADAQKGTPVNLMASWPLAV